MSGRMERKKEERKERILNAAEYLIAENGFKTMTMDQVASQADVAKGTLYLYFKNKNTLGAAVNARILKQLNEHMQEKMDLFKTGSEKILASGKAIIEFSHQNRQKWNARMELFQIDYKHPEDPNVQESLYEANRTIQIRADAYGQGIKEGNIQGDIDPVPTSIYTGMALINGFSPTKEQEMLLKLNKISPEDYLAISWDLIHKPTHIKPLIRK